MRVLLLVAVLSLATEARAQSPLSVGSVTAPPGQKVSGWLEVPDGVDAGTRIPVSVVHGARPGPVLALVAGTHGYEYTSIVALPRVLARLDPQRMAGSVILVHMANPPAFYGRRTYYSPDGKNLNRVYPGKADGTLSERIAFLLTREVIDKATHLVDLHCGDGNESLRPYSYWQVSGNPAVDEASKQMVLAFGLDHVVVDRERPKDPAKSMYTSNTAVLRGKPALTAESGGMGLTDEASVAAQEAGALSVIAHLGIADMPTRERAEGGVVRSQRSVAGHRHRPLVSRGGEDADGGRGHAPGPGARPLRQGAAGGEGALRRRSAVRGRHAAGDRRRAAGLRGTPPGRRAPALKLATR